MTACLLGRVNLTDRFIDKGMSEVRDFIFEISFVLFVILTLNPLTPELNPSAQRCMSRFLLGILLVEPCVLLIYA
jgi:hypothetical protein